MRLLSSSKNAPPLPGRRCLAWAAGIGCILGAIPADAEVLGTYVVNGNGTVTYTYQVDNTAGSFDVSLWSLEFPFATPDWNQLDTLTGGSVSIPNAHWVADAGVPVGGLSAQDFLSLDPAGDVVAGFLVGEFSFTSSYLPGPIAFFEYSPLGDFVTGTTTGPAILPPTAAIPEAGGWWAGVALTGLAALSARWRTHANTRRGTELH